MKQILILIILTILWGCTPPKAQNKLNSTSVLEKQKSSTETSKKLTKINIGEQTFWVREAVTPEERQSGLMFVDSMPKNEGMLFVFDQSKYHRFWMKNTYIPLDIIWISEDMTVVDVQTVQPCNTKECPNYVPKDRALYVLEVNAGIFEGKIGDLVQLNDLPLNE